MNRCSFLLIALLFPCVLTLTSGHWQAQAAVPILSNTAKKSPHVKKLSTLSSKKKKDISPFSKKIISHISFSSTCYPWQKRKYFFGKNTGSKGEKSSQGSKGSKGSFCNTNTDPA